MACRPDVLSILIAIAAVVLTGPLMGCSSSPEQPDEETTAEQPGEDDKTVPGLHYTFAPTEIDGSPAIAVELRFVADDSERTDLRIPDQWAHVQDYADGIVDLDVSGDRATLVQEDRGDAVAIEHDPGAEITLSYRVTQLFEQLTTAHTYRPRIADDHFHAIGYGIFVLPDDDAHTPRAVTLDWSAFDDWPIANSHGIGETIQSAELSRHELRRAIYIGGDYNMHRADVPGGPLHIATRGADPDIAGPFIEMSTGVLTAQREFFGDEDHDSDPILITLYYLDDARVTRGTAVFNSLGLWVGSTDQVAWERIASLTAHEAFHLWLGIEISAAPPSYEQQWFTEGFTNFYTGRFLLEAGVIDFPGLVNTRNRILQQYALSPVREATNEEVTEGFWSERDTLGQLAYYRGEALAMHWDAEIRNATDGDASLDDFMRALLDEARNEGTRVDSDVLARLIEPLYSDGPQELQRFVEDGQFIPPHPDALGPCVDLQTVDAPIFDPGFDTETAQSSGTITDVDPDNPAYEAGLRNGQTLLSMNARPPQGIELSEATVVVDDDGEEREFTYLPSSKSRQIELFTLDEERYDQDPDQCMPYS